MARITLRQLLDHAAENDYGLPAYNINNMEQGLAIMEAAEAVPGWPGWRGGNLDGRGMDLSKVEEIGLVLADGRAGDFRIEVDWIGVE